MRRPEHLRWPPIPAAPGFQVLARYQRSWLRGDILAGCTVAAYLIPQVMAYATIAGLPPVTGLWAILPTLAIYALLGSSRRMSVGPESTTALMTAAAIGPLADGDSVRYAALAAGLALLVGLICLSCWLARLGFVADLLSKPILVGYLAGLAVLMVISQLDKLTGVPVSGDTTIAQLTSLIRSISAIQIGTLLLGTVVLVFLFVVQRQWPTAPAALLAVLLAMVVTVVFKLQDHGIAVVGPIPSGLPALSLPPIGDYAQLILPALGVVLVGYTDNVLTARAFREEHEDLIDANQELLALGVANIGAGVLQGFPVSSSASRTALGAVAGSKTQMYSLVALGWVIGTLLFLSPMLSYFPTAALSAIVVYAAVRLIDLREFARFASFRRSELLLALAALAGVLVLGVLYGVLLAVSLSVSDMLARAARPHDAILGRVPGLAGMHDIDDYPTAQTIPGLIVYRYDSPLFFANGEDFRRRALAAVDEYDGPLAWFILNMEANVEVDITALDAVDSLRRELARRGIIFALTRVKQDLLVDLESFGLTKSVGRDRIFPTLPTAVEGYEVWAEQHRRTDGSASD